MDWLKNMMFGSLGGPADPNQPDPYGGQYNKKAAMLYALGNMGQGLGYGLMTRDWKNALAVSNADADGYQNQAMKKAAAARLMEEAEVKKQERAREAERQQWLDQQISQLPPEQQGIARMMPEKFFGAQIEQMFPNPNSGGQYFGTPIPYDMGDGRIGYGLPSKDGGFKALDAPNGGSFLGPYDKAYQASSGTTRGKIATEQEMSAPSDLSAAEEAIGILDQIVAHPAIELGTGFSSYGNKVRGTPGYDFQNLVDQAKSGAFLTAIDQLKGMGALSNMEGQAATAAVTRMDTATSEDAFLKAVADYRAIVERGAAKARSKINGGANPAAPEDPLGLR